jgi:hypothetical protein
MMSAVGRIEPTLLTLEIEPPSPAAMRVPNQRRETERPLQIHGEDLVVDARSRLATWS